MLVRRAQYSVIYTQGLISITVYLRLRKILASERRRSYVKPCYWLRPLLNPSQPCSATDRKKPRYPCTIGSPLDGAAFDSTNRDLSATQNHFEILQTFFNFHENQFSPTPWLVSKSWYWLCWMKESLCSRWNISIPAIYQCREMIGNTNIIVSLRQILHDWVIVSLYSIVIPFGMLYLLQLVQKMAGRSCTKPSDCLNQFWLASLICGNTESRQWNLLMIQYGIYRICHGLQCGTEFTRKSF